MSNLWFYEIDGQTSGPVEHTRLRLLVDSGMLQPHHKVRKEEQTAWSQAGAVRGLFTPTVTVPIAAVTAPAGPVPAPEQADSPFGSWAPPAPDASVPAGWFDICGDAETPPDPPPPKPAAKPDKSQKQPSARKTPEPTGRTPPVVTPAPPAPPPPPPEVDELDIPEAVGEVAEEGANPFAFEPLPIPPGPTGSRTAETKLTATPKPQPAAASQPEPAVTSPEPPAPEPPAQPVASRTSDSHAAAPAVGSTIAEVSG